MSHSSSESGMASRRDPNTTLFALGWILTAINFAGMAWAVYVPIGFYQYQKDILFSLDTAQSYGKINTLSVVAVLVLALLQIALLGRIARAMFSDSLDTAAAEAALKIARATAVVLALVCIASIVVDIIYYRRWYDYYQLLN